MTPHVWGFRPGAVTEVAYRDGTVVPHLRVAVLRDGEAVGFAQLHLHRTRDGHVSFGFTGSVERETVQGEGRVAS